MSRIILGILVGLALGAAGVLLLVRSPRVAGLLKGPETGEEQETQGQAEASFVQRDPSGQTVVKLDPNEQSLIGLKVAPLAAAEAPAEVKGFGRVLDPAPLAALVTEGASAQAALQASTKEYERVKTLFTQNQNASARALETAEAALSKDRVALESVRLRLLAGWGREIASQPDLPTFVAALAARQAALIRIDVPLGERPKDLPVGGRVALAGTPENVIEAQMLGPAPTTDPQAQTEGYLFLAKTEALAPGAAVVAWLVVPGPARSGVIVPRDAVLRHAGETYIYLQVDNVFQRKTVELERPLGNGWFVPAGANNHSPLQPQEKVVVVGAQELLSEELKGQGGGE